MFFFRLLRGWQGLGVHTSGRGVLEAMVCRAQRRSTLDALEVCFAAPNNAELPTNLAMLAPSLRVIEDGAIDATIGGPCGQGRAQACNVMVWHDVQAAYKTPSRSTPFKKCM